MTLATRLKTSRKKFGLSQAELAKQVDVSQPTIANWERGGHIPRPDALTRIAKVLKTDPAWLLSGEHPAESNPAHQHLAKPIYHIPVHDWPTDQNDPTLSQPVRYMAIAAEVTNLFALKAEKMTEFPDGTILVFSKTQNQVPGTFLIHSDDGHQLTKRDSLCDNIFGRLVYSVVPH